MPNSNFIQKTNQIQCKKVKFLGLKPRPKNQDQDFKKTEYFLGSKTKTKSWATLQIRLPGF